MIYALQAQRYQEAANSEPQPQIPEPPQEHLNPCWLKPLPNVQKHRNRCRSPSPLMLNPFSTPRAQVSKLRLAELDLTSAQKSVQSSDPITAEARLVLGAQPYCTLGVANRQNRPGSGALERTKR